MSKAPMPPKAAVRPEYASYHGRLHQDDYAWLKTPDWLGLLRGEAPLPENINEYLLCENAYAETLLGPLSELIRLLQQELRARVEDEELTIPERDGPYEYYWRYAAGSEQPLFARKLPPAETEYELLDCEQEAQGLDFFELGDYEVSPDHRHLAWSADCRGAELACLRVRDLTSGDDLDTLIDNIGTVTWLDNHYLLYTRIDDEHRASLVFRHHVHEPTKADVLVFVESDPAFEVSVGRIRSGKFVEIVSSCDGQDEVWLLNTASPLSKPVLFQARMPGLEYSIDHQGDWFYIHTNAQGAEDFQIMRTSVDQTNMPQWQAWYRPEAGVMILSMDVYRDWIVWMEQRDTLPKICFMNKEGNGSHISFDEAAYELDYSLSPEFNADFLRFSYESPTTQAQVWHYQLDSGERKLLKETKIPCGHDPTQYRVSRLVAMSADGTEVPLTCLYHRQTALDGTAPCVLEGYGSYGSSTLADFDADRFSLVDRGVVYALAHVRGGQEKGRAWYRAAKGALKPNSINDYLACATTLMERGYCRTDALVALGRSAGGLLVGAAVNEAPELFTGVIADVPFVDVLNTLLDDSHPLTPGEWGQWGNPLEDAQAFDWIAGYSPYDNVRQQNYPSMLITTALADPRVGYWEAAKWVARLRSLNSGSAPILLITQFDAGHGGVAGRYAPLLETAREIAFVVMLTDANLNSTNPLASTDT